MALVRVSALKDFRATALSTTDVTTGYQYGGLTSGQKFYAGLHLTSASLGTTARMLVMTIQSATASAFAAPTTRATFGLSTVIGSTWATPVGSLTTENLWWRGNWTLSTAASTGGVWKGLVYMGIKVAILSFALGSIACLASTRSDGARTASAMSGARRTFARVGADISRCLNPMAITLRTCSIHGPRTALQHTSSSSWNTVQSRRCWNVSSTTSIRWTPRLMYAVQLALV